MYVVTRCPANVLLECTGREEWSRIPFFDVEVYTFISAPVAYDKEPSKVRECYTSSFHLLETRNPQALCPIEVEFKKRVLWDSFVASSAHWMFD